MRPSACVLALVLGGVLLAFIAPPGLSREPVLQPAAVGDDANWITSQFFPVGADHEVMSAFVHDDDLVISGNFGGVSDVVAPGVARWDGAAWSAYPGTEWGGVLTEYNGMLTVVRAFPLSTQPDYSQVEVLSWNGSSWNVSPPAFQFAGSAGLDIVDRSVGGVAALGGDLYVTPVTLGPSYYELDSSHFARILRWDGSAWSAFVGGEGTNAYLALKSWNGQLFASGIEESVYDNFIDRWDGVSWTRDWSNPSGGDVVTDFVDHDGQLVAARRYSGLLQWDGLSWTSYADPITATVLASTASGLAAATVTNVERWDGSLWTVLGGLQGTARALAAYGGGLAAGGALAGNIAIFDGTSWETPGKRTGRGLAGDVEALASYEGKLYVAGRASYPGSDPVLVAAWDGATWETVRGQPGSRKGRAMTLYDGKLVVAESADYASVSPPDEIGTWDGATWTTLGTSPNWFQCLAVYNGDLIAGGRFTAIDAVSADHLAAFDGLAWSELGGVSGPFNASNPVAVNALAVWNGLLVVGGNFDTVGGTPFDYIASWDGSKWKDLEPNGNNPPAVTGPVKALAVYNGDLVASGSFWGTDVIAFWDGHDWTPMGSGLNAAPQALAAYGGYLLASGENLSMAGGVPVNRIAAWDGVTWDALGSGLEHPRPASESPGWAFSEHQGVLYVGGNFRSAGGKAADRLAMWASPTALTGVPEGPARPAFSVRPGLPNPCRSAMRIALEMPRAGRVTATVFDAAGRQLGTIVDREFPAGPATITWSPRVMADASGSAIPAGAYFIRVGALGEYRTQKVVYLP